MGWARVKASVGERERESRDSEWPVDSEGGRWAGRCGAQRIR